MEQGTHISLDICILLIYILGKYHQYPNLLFIWLRSGMMVEFSLPNKLLQFHRGDNGKQKTLSIHFA
jgi:hypothetical protein